MDKGAKCFQKILAGHVRTQVRLRVQHVKFSRVTRQFVLTCDHARFNDRFLLPGGIRFTVPPRELHRLKVLPKDTLELTCRIAHNQYSFWIVQPRDVKVYRYRNIQLRMQRYIYLHDERAKASWNARRRHR